MKIRNKNTLRKKGKNIHGLTEISVDKDKVHHHSLYFKVPSFYRDKKFTCKECAKEEVWTATQQKWWYEEAGGDLETTAVRCRECRNKTNKIKSEQKRHMIEMAKKEPHPNEKFFKNT